jgi:HK97 family phage portal protein
MGKISSLLRRAGVRLASLLRGISVQPVRTRGTIPSKNLAGALAAIKQDEWLYTGLARIADGVIFAPHSVKTTDGKPVDKREPVAQIFEKPNPLQRWPEFIETIIFHWRGAGNAYILMDARSELGNPTELWPLRPDRVKPLPAAAGSAGLLAGYEYTRPDGSIVQLQAEDVIPLQFTDPENIYVGMGVVEALRTVFETDIAAAAYAQDYFRNGADPGTVLSTEKTLDDEVRKAVLSGWDDAHQARKGRAHATALLEGGLKVEKTGSTPKEADFLETRKANREAILAALGVQPLKAGITEGSNRATAFIQERSWQRDTITPLLRRLEPALTVVAATFGAFVFAFDDLVVEDNEMDAQIATAYLMAGALTPNEVREHYAGLEKVKGVPGMDTFYLPVNLLPVGETGDPVEAPGNKPGATEPAKIEPPRAAGGDERAPRGTALQRRVLAAYIRQRAREEKRWRLELSRYFKRQGAEIADAYAGGREVQGVEGRALDTPGWTRLTRKLHDATMTEQYELAVDMFHGEADPDFKPGGTAWELKARRLAQRVKDVPEVTKSRLDDVIRDGLEKGLSPSEIAYGTSDGSFAGIEGLFEEFAASRAQLIARTESAAAMDQSNTQAYRDLGVGTCDVIGCEDEVIFEGQTYGCNSQNIPLEEAENIEFHPNHKGAIVPRVERLAGARLLTASQKLCYNGNGSRLSNGQAHVPRRSTT